MLNILHIASGDLWAGAEVQLFNLAVELNEQTDLELLVILLNQGILETRLREKEVAVQVLDESKLSAFAIAKGLIKAIRIFQPDVVHTHRTKENILGSVSAKLAGSAICVRTVHGQGESKLRPWNIHKYVYGITDQLCGRWLQDRVIAVSEPLAQLLARKFPVKSVVTIENGVNIDELNLKSHEPLPAPLPGKLNSIKVCIVCRLTPVKRLDVFLEIAEAVRNILSDDYDFYIFGDGNLWDEVSNEINECGLADTVHMMGFQSNVPAYLSHMDALLITSDHEGLPMNMLESMALGVFVIAHSTGGIASVLGDDKYGMAIGSQNVESFVKGIKVFNEDKERLQQINKLTLDMVTSKYSSVACAEKHIRLYAELIK